MPPLRPLPISWPHADEYLKGMVDALPTFLREAPEILASFRCFANERARCEYFMEIMRGDLAPGTIQSTEGLAMWEGMLGYRSDSSSAGDRVSAVLARTRASVALGSEQVAAISQLVGAGWSYIEHVPGDSSTPDANQIRVTLPSDTPVNRQYIRSIIGAGIHVIFASVDGFRLDTSQLDTDAMP